MIVCCCLCTFLNIFTKQQWNPGACEPTSLFLKRHKSRQCPSPEVPGIYDTADKWRLCTLVSNSCILTFIRYISPHADTEIQQTIHQHAQLWIIILLISMLPNCSSGSFANAHTRKLALVFAQMLSP